ncbi:hypothetical protein TNCT_102491 [Trichonephila clavata]|uniref:Uncharacterized protein n=1 Tax=Trichonephila clavata TaxID=2740835 RepID=A0A8X6KME3_TRICU|nr:hypothetical protein TNCT_102491 [Trichonephila clavata]
MYLNVRIPNINFPMHLLDPWVNYNLIANPFTMFSCNNIFIRIEEEGINPIGSKIFNIAFSSNLFVGLNFQSSGKDCISKRKTSEFVSHRSSRIFKESFEF